MIQAELHRDSGAATADSDAEDSAGWLVKVLAAGPAVLAAGMLALGIQSLLLHDFISGWQPVPQGWPSRTALAIDSALLVIGCSVGMLTGRWRRQASIGMAIVLLAWLVVLHIPFIARGPAILAQWLGAGETAFILAGVLILARSPDRSPFGVDLRLVARMIAGVCLLYFAACHFYYAEFTAEMIPVWMPQRLFWVYATGTGYAAAGLAMLSGVLATPAAWATAAMMGSFTVLVHIQRIVDSGGAAPAWKLMFATVALAGSAWVLALDTRHWRSR